MLAEPGFMQLSGLNLQSGTKYLRQNYGKSSIFIFKETLLVLTKFLFLEEDMALNYNSMNFCLLKSVGNS